MFSLRLDLNSKNLQYETTTTYWAAIRHHRALLECSRVCLELATRSHVLRYARYFWTVSYPNTKLNCLIVIYIILTNITEQMSTKLSFFLWWHEEMLDDKKWKKCSMTRKSEIIAAGSRMVHYNSLVSFFTNHPISDHFAFTFHSN